LVPDRTIKTARTVRTKTNTMNLNQQNELKISGKLINGQQLLEELFSPEAKPSMRWLRTQTAARAIPFIRIGHLVFFDVEIVKRHLAGRVLGGRRF
jgi:hypothetical protein